MHTLSLLIWVAVCAVQDARQRKISNVLTLGGAALALGYLLLAGETWLGAAPSITSVLLALALTLPGYFLRNLGAADVKLLVFIALASDSQHVLLCLIGAGVCYLAWYVLARRVWVHLGKKTQSRLGYFSPDERTYPFGPFLFLGLGAAIWLAG